MQSILIIKQLIIKDCLENICQIFGGAFEQINQRVFLNTANSFLHCERSLRKLLYIDKIFVHAYMYIILEINHSKSKAIVMTI